MTNYRTVKAILLTCAYYGHTVSSMKATSPRVVMCFVVKDSTSDCLSFAFPFVLLGVSGTAGRLVKWL